MSILSEKTHTTKKNHRCSWCGEIIEAKTEYVDVVAHWDDFTCYKFHPECHTASYEFPEVADGWELYEFKRGTYETR